MFHHHHHHVGIKDGLDTLAVTVGDNEFEERGLDEEESGLLWQELAAQRPGHDNANLEDPDALGRRDIDRAFDWAPYINKYPGLRYDWWNIQKEQNPKSLEVDYASQSTADELNRKQRQIYDMGIQHYTDSLDP